MAVEQDQSDWVPSPPPPRPQARTGAIEAALRKFDGGEEAAATTPRPVRTIRQHPRLALAMSVLLLLVIFIPATMRQHPSAVLQTAPSTTTQRNKTEPLPQDVSANSAFAPVPQSAPSEEQAPPPNSATSAPQAVPQAKPVLTGNAPAPLAQAEQAPNVSTAAPAREADIAGAAPPPPPPPPPPAPAAQMARIVSPATDNIVVTGTLRRTDQKAAAKARSSAEGLTEPYGILLSRLQAAVRANDRARIVALIDFPLRVNSAAGAWVYQDREAVEQDFDRIFTPRVTRAILKQKASKLTTTGDRAMIGKGEVWLAATCANARCSPSSPVGISEVNASP